MKKGFNHKNSIKKENLSQKSPKQNWYTHGMHNLKTAIVENKVQVISRVIVILLIIAMIILAMNQASNMQNHQISPELAKAMTYDQVEEGDEVVEGTDNVKFDAFFLRDINQDGYAESIRGTSKEIGKEDTLYMELNVQTAGYLKDAKITVNGQNFYLQTALPKDDELKDNYVGNNIKEIAFNTINNGTQKLLTGIVRSGDYSYTSKKAEAIGNDINNYSKVNSVTLTGTYVDEGGNETSITKTVEFNVDWYGTTTARAYTTTQNKNQNITEAISEEEGTINLEFTIYAQETDQKLLLSKNYVEGQIPELNGYAPINVEYIGSNATFHYDTEAKTFSITREATVNETGIVTSKLSNTNSYKIRAIYPLEAYQTLGADTVEIKIPVKTYYEGYNNPSEEFTNPYKSNTAQATIVANYQNPTGTMAEFEVIVGKRVYNPESRYIVSKQKPLNIYNGQSEEEKDDTYIVTWRGITGSTSTGNMVMKETRDGETQVTDEFIKTNAQTESMEDVTSFTGIYFSNPEDILGEDGEIKVYDEDTGNLLVTFNKNNWDKYSSNNPYIYALPVKHIRVETSNTTPNASLYVYHVKTLDDEEITTKYTKEQFDELEYIKSTLTGYIGGEYINTDTEQAIYEAPMSIANISLSNNTISTQTTEKNLEITIQTQTNESYNLVKWKNGTFLVKLPEEIIDVQINSITIDNSNVSLENYELFEQDGARFIKIGTKNNTLQTYNITINIDVSPDPRKETTTKDIELYATNEQESEYYYGAQDIYDVNNNVNTEEEVNHTTTSISMVSPNSLLTNQVATNYDDKGSEVVSPQIADIKPSYAIVDQEEKTVQIGVQIHNNYASTISEIQILGKIPFEGNTYVISGGDLGSTFTTKMVSTGIEIPEELQQYVTVYYSENENPDRDLSKQTNGWKTAGQVENWDNIKTFLIDFGAYIMPMGKEFVFNYTIKIPNGVEFNQIAYSHHGVYFSLDTEQGKYRTQTEPNKLGLRIAEKYNLELTKYQIGKDKLIQGATYSITEIIKNEGGEETRGESKTSVTNAQGKLTITNLYAEKEYEIREINSPDDYELNENVIRFITHVDEQGNLNVQKINGTTKGEMEVVKNEEENYKVTVQVEDEVKAKIKIIKKEQGTENTIQGARFKLTGYNISENGRSLTTNGNGEFTFNGLSVNQEYTLQEVKAEGYYLANPIKLKIINQNEAYSVQIIQGEIVSQTTTEEDSIPTINITIEDEKIPTYNMQLIKVKKTTESTLSNDELIAQAETTLANTEVEYLEGAKFKLYKGTEEIGEYTTDATGKVTISGLYQYDSTKDIDQTYTLKEVLAPDGYAKVKDITFKVEEQDGNLVFRIINENGEEQQGENYIAEGNTIQLTIQDSPSFRLIKKDAETQSVIPNVKFAIYHVDDGSEQPATNSKGEMIGTKETINGKEYYTVTTDENGEITADLTEGLYKAVEVQAPDQYDILNNIYYFGIGASREAETTIGATQAMGIGGSSDDQITSVVSTSDGGYLVGGYFSSSEIQLGDDNKLTSTGSYDGMIIKYDKEGNVQWARSIGGDNDDRINAIIETSDKGYLVVGYFNSSEIQLEDERLINNSSSTNYCDGMIIKYGINGEVEWAKSVGGLRNDRINSVIEISDEEYIVGGYFYSSEIQLGDDNSLTNNSSSTNYSDGMIIRYDKEGNVQWATNVGGSSNDQIISVVSTSDRGFIVGGNFSSDEIQIGNDRLTNSGSTSNGMLIKYNKEGNVEWAKGIESDGNVEITSLDVTSDEGFIVGGYFGGSEIQVGEYRLTNNSTYTYNRDGMIIKYDKDGEAKWAKNIGGSGDDYINSVASTVDEGFIVGGYFNSSEIQVGKYTVTNNSISYGSYGGSINYSDGMIIKYDKEGEVKGAINVGQDYNETINSVSEISDETYIATGLLGSDEIQVGDDILTNNGNGDGMIVKIESEELGNPVVTNAEGIGTNREDEILSVSETRDGGYIAAGYFQGNEIHVGEYILTNNSSNSDGMIIKYNSQRQVEWATNVGGSNNDGINSIIETSDEGYIAVGYFYGTIEVGGYTLVNQGYTAGMVIKYNTDGEVEWATSVGSSSNQIDSIAETKDGGFIVVGYFSDSEIQVGDYTLTNQGATDGMIIKYNADGEVEWATSVGGSSNEYINSVASTSDRGFVVGGYFNSNQIQVGDNRLTNNSSSTTDGIIIKYNVDGKVEWAKNIGGSGNEYINSVASTVDGGFVLGGYFNSSQIQLGDNTLTNNNSSQTPHGHSGGSSTNYSDGMIIKYDDQGNVEWATSIGGNNNDYISSVAFTSDGGFVAGGYFNSDEIQIANDTLTNNSSSIYYSDGMIIKYNADEEVEWAKSVGENDRDYIQSVTETSDGRIIAGGYFNSDSIEVDGKTITNSGSSDGMILEIVNQIGVPEIQELTVENDIKSLKITTDVKVIDGEKGGQISGEDETPYEVVKYGENSTQEIQIIPDSGYKIVEITVNGEEYTFEANTDGSYTMPLYTNMTEDKHIVVTFASEDEESAKVIVHHYLKNKDGEYTTEKVAEDDILEGKIGETYTSTPHLDLENYELEKDENGSYVMPESATGTYASGTIEITYYYEEKEIPLTVHHYIEGTTTPVPLKDGTEAKDEQFSGKQGEEYQTNEIVDSLLSDAYEISEIPENAIGVYTGEEVIVTYYYKLVERSVTIVKTGEDREVIEGVTFEIVTKEKPEEVLGTYETNSNGQIKINLTVGEYIAREIQVPEGYTLPGNAETEFTVEKSDEAITVNITNTKKKGQIITHHYIEGTEEHVPALEGGVVQDVIQSGNIGDIYATQQAGNIANNYEFISSTENTSGEIVEGTIEVIYYYRLKTPEITNSEITKESSVEKVTDVKQVIDYTVNYKTVLDTYKGKAIVTIVDELPYEIDESKAYELDGGIYNKENKTITWIEEIGDIDTFVNGAEEIGITKEISFVYKDIDVRKANIENKVTGTINLVTPEKEDTVEDTEEIPTEYLVNIPVTKVWSDNENIAGKRPSAVEVVVKNGTEEVRRQELNTTNNWTDTFTGLPKYDSLGNEINYVISEEEKNVDDLKFYAEGVITGSIEEGYIITNTFVVPDERVSVKVTKKWIDTAEQQDKRPTSVEVVLKNGVEEVERQELNISNNWEHTFTNLSKYDNLGNEIEYTVEEVETNEFYTNSGITGNMTEGYEITNTFVRPNDTVEVPVTKVWEDNNNEAKKRPESVTIKVTGNGKTYTQEINESNAEEGNVNHWTYTFTNLPKYDENGDEIKYTIDEENTNSEFYQKTEVNQEAKTITNTFQVPGDTVTVIGKKEWVDNNDAAQKRPENVTLQIKNGEQLVQSGIVNAGNNWTYEFHVPKYDENANEITYTVDEVDTGSIFYTKIGIEGDMLNGYTVTNTFQVPDEKVEVSVTKVWEDNNNEAEKRPESITVKVIGSDGQEYTKQLSRANAVSGNINNWSETFTNLPKYDENGNEIQYTIDEENVNSEFYQKTEVNQETKTITNTFIVPDDKIEVPVTKVWIDNNNLAEKRPESITVKLTGSDGNEYTKTLSNLNAIFGNMNNWTDTFTDLPKYDALGNEIKYTLSEEATGSIFYTEENTVINQENGMIINTFEVPDDTIEVPVMKVWNDSNNKAGKRPESVTVKLTGNGNTYEQTLTSANVMSGNTNYWTYTFIDLPKYDALGDEIDYTLSEEPIGSIFYTEENSVIDQETKTITNTFEVPSDTVEVSVTKIWEDSNNEAEKRPERITIKVTGNGETYTQEINESNAEEGNVNHWTYTFTNLPKYDENGDEIEYTIDEENINSEFYQKTNINQEERTITNTFQVPGDTVTVIGRKEWIDNNDEAQKRPENVTLQIKNGERLVQSGIVNVGNNWTYEFHVPKYDENGDEITYTVDEVDIGSIFYTKTGIEGDMLSGYTVTNTFQVPNETVEITVNKVWEDNAIQEQRRPEVVIINVIGEDDRLVQSYDLNVAEGEASHTFIDLPKYNRLGNEIEYTVEEQEKTEGDLKFYTSKASKVTNVENEQNKKQATITNTFTRPEDTTQIIVNKIWNDNETQSQRRPESIIIVVKNRDQEVATKEITKEDMLEETTNQWSTIIDKLQKYDDNGEEIQYTVEEREKTIGDLKFYEPEEAVVTVEDNQATIRNTFVKPDDTTTVTVNKVWNDSNNVNEKRPESIKLQVKNGESIVKEQVINVEDANNGDVNNWTYTFTNLPKYDDNGQEFVYTVSEVEVHTDDLKFYTNDSITGDMTSGYIITNTFTVPDERIELTVNKVWDDNDTQADRRPERIIINVKAENADNNDPGAVIDTYELNTETETSHTFIGLPKYNRQGNEIQYTVEEQEKNPGDLHFYTTVVGTVETTGKNTKEVTITNTFEKPDDTTEVTVTKVWNDNNDEAEKRPESINLQLKNGNTTVKEQEVNVSNAVSGDTNTWQYTFTGVDKYNDDGQEIIYTVDETEVNSNDLQFYTKKLEGTTVTNIFTQNIDKVEIPVKKIWEDNEIQAQRRPESVIIILKANGIENQRYELSKENTDTSDENTWVYTFTDLPKYDQYNNIINYTIEEEEKTQGDLKFYTTSIDGYTITNTFTRPTETIRIEVNKHWEDQENIYNKRPSSIRLEVKNGDQIVSAVVTKDDNWSAIFTNLPKYDENGQEIEYIVDEEEVSPNDLFYYEKQVGEVTDKDRLLDEKEATITNTMTKIPSTVVVKYVDKNTGEEISDSKTKEGIIGDTFDVTEDKKDIDGYTLIEEPAEKTGVYTAESQEKIYYYAKNTKVIVKYLEQDDTPEDIADNQVLVDEVTIEGYEGQDYTTQAQDIEGYTLVAVTDNTEGSMQREEIVVIYYYAPNTNVIIKYLEKDDTPNNSDNKVLTPEEIINGYVGREYTTQAQDIEGYTLVAVTDNTEGTMTKDPIEVIYYYAQNTKVIVKYLEQDETPEDNTDNQVLAEEITIEGHAGQEYTTQAQDIEGYTLVARTNNTEGTMTNDVIEVIYYYAQNTKATVQHIDRETGEILKEQIQEGKVGDLFETQAEDFEGYILVESPEEPNIIMDKTGEQVVKYYYVHVSAGVIEKHIDDITGELLYSEEHQGNEGDTYNIPSREFDGYDLVTEDEDGNSRLPENAQGDMRRDEVIEVKYYYIKKAKVIVKYLEQDDTPEDTTDNQVLSEEEMIEGHENDNYETEAKEIEGYNLVETPENATGSMLITKNPDGTYDTEIEVIYYYKKVAGGVVENHIDITTNEILATQKYEGNVGDAYDIPSREFGGYDLLREDENGNSMLPTNAIGNMTEEEIVVNYYYIKQAKVTVEYIDKLTGEKLDEEEIQGHIGDSYDTEEKEFDGYDIVEKPSNSTGEMTEEETVVKYYYQRKAEVEVKYLERGTEYEIAPSETIEGYVGDNYETEKKEIPYYDFVESTDNINGTMQEDKITVIYYYEKQVFNLGIDKWVSSVNVDGINQGARNINNKDEMYVVDIHRSKTEIADIRITYKIRVTNKGEIEGTAGEIIEILPAGYSYYQEDNNIYWEERNGTLVTDILTNKIIQPGEYEEVEIVLRWNTGEDNFGEKENLVILSGEQNPAGYEDIDKEDNQSSSNMMITVSTGLDRNGRFILNVVLQILIFVAGVLLFMRRRRK